MEEANTEETHVVFKGIIALIIHKLLPSLLTGITILLLVYFYSSDVPNGGAWILGGTILGILLIIEYAYVSFFAGLLFGFDMETILSENGSSKTEYVVTKIANNKYEVSKDEGDGGVSLKLIFFGILITIIGVPLFLFSIVKLFCSSKYKYQCLDKYNKLKPFIKVYKKSLLIVSIIFSATCIIIFAYAVVCRNIYKEL